MDKFSCRTVSFIGLSLITTGLLCSALCPTIDWLLVTYGVLVGMQAIFLHIQLYHSVSTPCSFVSVLFQFYTDLLQGIVTKYCICTVYAPQQKKFCAVQRKFPDVKYSDTCICRRHDKSNHASPKYS